MATIGYTPAHFIRRKMANSLGKETYILSPSFGSGEADFELFSTSSKKPKANNYSRIDLFLFFLYFEKKGFDFSAVLRGIIFVLSQYQESEQLISRLEHACYKLTLDEEGIAKDEPLSVLEAILSASGSEEEDGEPRHYLDFISKLSGRAIDSDGEGDEIEAGLRDAMAFLEKHGERVSAPKSDRHTQVVQSDKKEGGDTSDTYVGTEDTKSQRGLEAVSDDDGFVDFLASRSVLFRTITGISPSELSGIDRGSVKTKGRAKSLKGLGTEQNRLDPIRFSDSLVPTQHYRLGGISEKERLMLSRILMESGKRTLKIRINQ